MLDAELARAAHLNMLAFMRRSAELAEAGAVDRVDGALLIRMGARLPFLNGIAAEERAADPGAALDRGEEFFAGHAAGFVVFAREGDPADDELRAACRAREFFYQPRYPELVCDERLAEPETAAPDCEVRRVEDERSAREYWDLCDRAYPSLGFPPDTFKAFPESLLLDDQTSAFVAYRDGAAVACALGWLDGDVNFIGWVATAEEARRTGLGALCTVRATNDGFDRGARFASLQASPMGLSVYLRLGYREIANYEVFGRVFETLK